MLCFGKSLISMLIRVRLMKHSLLSSQRNRRSRSRVGVTMLKTLESRAKFAEEETI